MQNRCSATNRDDRPSPRPCAGSWKRRWGWAAGLLLVLPLGACVTRPVDKPMCKVGGMTCKDQPLFTDKDVDILFVVDNSGSMGEEQANLTKQFPRLIEALRTDKLGPDRPLPNVRIGVVSTDLGAGSLYGDNSCVTDGDRGKLHNKAMAAGCTPPKDAWIEYKNGQTNIPGAGQEAISQVKSAFGCVAQLGVDGCGFEQPLMSAKMALDPALNVNPGFLRNGDPCKEGREDALLAVVFITDEDDCSASNPTLFDPSQGGLNDPLGPLTSYRCFEFGVTCKCAGGACGRTTSGPRTNCVGSGKYLHSVDSFKTFFQGIKKLQDLDEKTSKCAAKNNPDRVIMAAISGPTDRVEVGTGAGGAPVLKASCSTSTGAAVPAIRVKELVHAFAKELTLQEVADIKSKKKNTPYFVDAGGKWREENFTSICTSDFSPALERLGERIVGQLGTLCLSPPALNDRGEVLCRKGDVLCDAATCGQQVLCQEDTLYEANMTIQTRTASGRTSVEKCPASLWDAKIPSSQCGSQCPCWRIVSSAKCAASKGSSPYAVEIMHQGEAPKGTYASVCNLASPYPWGSAEFASQEYCN